MSRIERVEYGVDWGDTVDGPFLSTNAAHYFIGCVLSADPEAVAGSVVMRAHIELIEDTPWVPLPVSVPEEETPK